MPSSGGSKASNRMTRQHEQHVAPAPKRQDNPILTGRNGHIQPQAAPRAASNSTLKLKKKRNPLNFSKPNPEFVEVFVGSSDTKPFKIHMDAIIHHSSFFKNAFTNTDYQEAKTKVMKLEDVDEKVFGLFNNWLYTQEIEHTNATEPELMELAKLWTAAGIWKIPSLQNQAMGELTNLIIKDPQPPTKIKDNILQQFLIHAYATKEETVLKKLAVQKLIRVLPNVVSLKEWAPDFPEGLLVDFAEELMKHHQSLPKEYKVPKFRGEDYMVKEDDEIA